MCDSIADDDRPGAQPSASPHHGGNRGPMRKLTDAVVADPAKLEVFRGEHEAIVGDYLRDNVIQQHYLMTRAKV
jgi:hypothetical protein